VLYGDSTTNTNRYPAWSPLNSDVAFSSNPSNDHEWNGTDGGALSQIFIVSTNNLSSVKLTTEGGEHPAWSPDGSKIIYCRFNPWVNPLTDSRNGRLWIMNSDGTNKQQITFP
ncbi:MAG: hypothetical protein Q7W05_04760, partial [Deltaproteobacteria bacterium]|nr:hypothetical protein [Deltaproteobacteria bacterium]